MGWKPSQIAQDEAGGGVGEGVGRKGSHDSSAIYWLC